jgi:hypothetical protein
VGLSQQAGDVLNLFDWLDIQKGTHAQQLGECGVRLFV